MAFSLASTQTEVNRQIDRLSRILEDMPVTVESRYALSEIVLIRGASIFEEALASIAYKLACGAVFPDGSPDRILVNSRSLVAARNTMRTEGGSRTPPKDFLRWTKARHVAESVRGVIDPTSRYMTTCTRFGSIIAEIFEVRNHAAHKNSSSRRKYMKWVKQQYGQERNIRLGYFLLTRKISATPNVERYLTSIKVIVSDLAAGR